MEERLVLFCSLLSLFLLPSSAQLFSFSGLPSCVPVLAPCLYYMHTDTPPPSCCSALKTALEKEGDCLCGAFQDKNLLERVKMTQDEMVKFPSKCSLSLPNSANCTAALKTQENKVPAPSQAPTASKAEPTSPPLSAPADESGAHGKSLQGLTTWISAVILPLIAVFHV
ncbi:hypothetical protein LUZ62_024045 [Rhynchospora pubera]|uniref:Bifunctional inhibitor/plant lipid transfer protein/seed storage helical domain-containing protein n=1 Tax=Rhynchospora pubera TaxID=906938 RepID=A0AAV8H437_9POAL|nr:hypothetical protein LUZ62_024045 [Rhynchospora pubera]